MAAASDTRLSPADAPIAPYSIACQVNGAGVGSLSFETFAARDGALLVYRNGLAPAATVYGDTAGFAIADVELQNGRYVLEITATDIAVPPNTVTSVQRFLVE
jgi:hypothetical protein